MKIRVITGSIFGIVFLTFLYLGNIPFLIFCTLAASIGCYEYYKMSKNKPTSIIHLLIGFIYILAGFSAFWFLRYKEGIAFVLYLLIIIWGTDSFAYFTGRKFGKNKLTPKISPNKTWEGSVGGTLITVVLTYVYYLMYKPIDIGLSLFLLITILLSISGQIGDLIESFVKRYYGVKDSGNILPGHGGFLDRFDSLMLVSIIATLILQTT
jgi:phosphatidate cytidylyltransferase